MQLKFKIQPYQTNAVKSVVDCFAGQKKISGNRYRVDPGVNKKRRQDELELPCQDDEDELWGIKNADIQLTDTQLLNNIRDVQKRQHLPLSDKLVESAGCKVNLDVEMETGTGKTYCYIKTFFEMNERYGFCKFIVVVPSIAIREGVLKTLKITAEHFTESYSKKALFFPYSSKQLNELETFTSSAGINVMVINIQAFNATGKDNLRIYKELDDFQSRRPIDVISSNRPILILDEPQKMGPQTLKALAKFKPLMILRYSATHRTTHNLIHRLDALDAYNQKLVKKITVRGISVKGLTGTNSYLYLEAIDVSKAEPVARIEIEVRQKDGIKRVVKRLGKGRKLFDESNQLEQYRGFVISAIDAREDSVAFINGHTMNVGEVSGDATEITTRRIQIRETIKAHFEKEQHLYGKGIKVLSLFFIDQVAKYRNYNKPDEKSEYAHIFEEEYEQLKAENLGELSWGNEDYRQYLNDIAVDRTHNGYFSIDKKTKQLTDPKFPTRGELAGLSDDVAAYDLIMKEKERLLSFDEPTRFIFSHSALREGWDNPNIFVMCMLKHSDSTISRRQEVGRGLRLCVNQHGDRMDNEATVHDINILTVVVSESYKDFVVNLQSEISDALSARPRKADAAYFTGKILTIESGTLEITISMAKQIYRYLVKNDYTDDADRIIETYHEAKSNGTLAPLFPELALYEKPIFDLINSVFSESQLPPVSDDRKPKRNPLNENYKKKEFKALWKHINRKAIYCVEFDSQELIQKSICELNKKLQVTPLQYTIQSGIQSDQITDTQLKEGKGFTLTNTSMETDAAPIHSMVKYDLIGKIVEGTQLTRKTIAGILSGIDVAVFDKFKQNPEHFIAQVARLINEQKAATIIKCLRYDSIDETYSTDIFTNGQEKQNFGKYSEKLKKHIYDYVIADSKVERDFASELDTSAEVVVYTKLPRGFQIPTPIGDYNPDWAIVFKEGTVKHIHFVAETKGSMSTLELRYIEGQKIECARKFFEEINRKIAPEHVKYEVVDSYGKLMEIVGTTTVSKGSTK